MFKVLSKRAIYLAPIFTFFFGIINFFYFCSHTVMAPDAFASPNPHFAGNGELALGRWGIRLVDSLRAGLVEPWLIVIISLFILSLTSIVLVKLFHLKRPSAQILLVAFLAFSIQFAETAEFIYCFDSYCWAMFFATLSAYLLSQKPVKKYSIPLSLLCIVITLSLYQAYIGVTVSLLLAVTIKDLFLKRQKFKPLLVCLLKYAFWVLLGLLAYYLLTKIILKLSHVELSSYKGANASIFSILSSLGSSIFHAYRDCFNYFFTDAVVNNSPYYRRWLHLILCLVLVVQSALLLKRRRTTKNLPLILSLFILLPVAANLIDLIAPTTKINPVTGAGLLTFYFLAISIYDQTRFSTLYQPQKLLSLFFLAILPWTFFLSNTASFMAREEVYRNFYATSSDIFQKAEALSDYSSDLPYCYNDIIRYAPQIAQYGNGFISKDNASWKNFNGIRTYSNYYRIYFGRTIKTCSKAQYNQLIASPEYASMPVFPAKGSVRIINNIIMVKLNDSHF